MLFALSEQSDPDFEVVVADDGSGPGTAATVERWGDAFGGALAPCPPGRRRLPARPRQEPRCAGCEWRVPGHDRRRLRAAARLRARHPEERATGLVPRRQAAGALAGAQPARARRAPAHPPLVVRALAARARRRESAGGAHAARSAAPRPRRPAGVRPTHGAVRLSLRRLTGTTSSASTASTCVTRAGARRTSTSPCACAGSGCAAAGRDRKARCCTSGTRAAKGPRPNLGLLEETRAADRVEAVSGLRELDA